MHLRPTQRWKLFSVFILVLASVSELRVCLGPPCFEHGTIAIGTFVITLVCYVVGLRFCSWKMPSTPGIASCFLLTSALLCTYLWLFLHYTYPLPDHCQREVGSWELTPGAKAILEPGEDVRDLIQNNENRVEGIFTAESMRAMRFALTTNWLSLMGSLSFLLALITTHSELGTIVADLLPTLREVDKRDLADRLSPLDMSSANDQQTERANQIVVSQIREDSRDTRFNIVFLHGVDGHWRRTWGGTDDKTCWLEWMAEDFPNAGVWSVHYHASTLHWGGGETMRLGNRATNLMSLLNAEDIFARPSFFIVHSFGGLVVKQMWHNAKEERRKDIERSVRGVLFLSTPHLGARLASYLQLIFIRTLLQPTVTVTDLTEHAPELIDLTRWYRNNPIKHNYVFFETQPLVGRFRVVDEVSADPQIKGVTPIPLHADHVSICKPPDRTVPLVKLARKAIKETMLE